MTAKYANHAENQRGALEIVPRISRISRFLSILMRFPWRRRADVCLGLEQVLSRAVHCPNAARGWSTSARRAGTTPEQGDSVEPPDEAIQNGLHWGTGRVRTITSGNPPNSSGRYGRDVNPFGISIFDDDNFVVRLVAYLQIRTVGSYRFRNYTDERSSA